MKFERRAWRRVTTCGFIVFFGALFSANALAAVDVELQFYAQARLFNVRHWPLVGGIGVGLILVQLVALIGSFFHQASRLQPSALVSRSGEMDQKSKAEPEPEPEPRIRDLESLLTQADHAALSHPATIGTYIDDLVAISNQTVLEQPAAAALVLRQWMSKREGGGLPVDEVRAVTVLLTMSEAAGKAIAAQMCAQELERLSSAMMDMPGRHRPYIANAVREFLQELDQAMPLVDRVPRFIKHVILPAVEATKSAHDISKMMAAAGYCTEIEALGFVAPQLIAEVLEDEHPQIVAVALMMLQPKQAAAVLSYLALSLRRDVLLRMAKMDSVPPFALEELSHIIDSNRSRLEQEPPQVVDGIRGVAAMLNAATSEVCVGLLDTLQRDDPKLSKTIQASMWGVETLSELDVQSRDRFMASLAVDTLSLLIQGLDGELIDLWLASVPADLAARIRDQKQLNRVLSKEEITAFRLVRQQLAATAALDETPSNLDGRGVEPSQLAQAGVD